MASLEFSSRILEGEAAPQVSAPTGTRRLLLLGGIALILAGMLFGDVFAVFILHENAARVGANLAGAAHAALAGNVTEVQQYFQNVGAFLENRGTKVDTHVHMIDFGYLALLLAVIEPWIALSPLAKRRIAWIFFFGAGLLPVSVYLIHYVGLVYSPFVAIGWASVAADFGGFLVIVATLVYFAGLWRHFRSSPRSGITDHFMTTSEPASRLLLAGGLLLVILGFLGGASYSAFDLYNHEARDVRDLSQMSVAAAARQPAALDSALTDYGQLQGEKAVKIAAHAHAVEFGLLAMMLAFFQPLVAISAAWKRRWGLLFLLGSAVLPLFVLLELRLGLVAGGIADGGGLLVIIALLAMWIGILRFRDEVRGVSASMVAAAKVE